MMHQQLESGRRKAVNVSLDTGIVDAARAAGLNLSQICEAALREASRRELGRRWKEENRAAMEAWGPWIEEHGLPLEEYRTF